MSDLNGQSDKDNGLARLRQQKAELASDDREAGRAAGREWALTSADYSDLVALKAARIGKEVTAHAVAETVDGDVPGVFGSHHQEQSPRFYGGFVSGAVEVLDEVDAHPTPVQSRGPVGYRAP